MVRLSGLVCLLVLFGCKPTGEADNNLQTIVSQDETQAFGLAGIRRMGQEDQGISLALITCDSNSAQKAAVWLLQAINMGVFGETYLEKTGDIRFRNEFGNYHRIPCKVVRMADGKPTQLYDMRTIRMAFKAVGSMPKAGSANEKKKFIAAQTLFLSMRGPSFLGKDGIDYSKGKGGDITFATYHEVARAKGTLSDSEVLMLANNIKQRDPLYNPCDRRSATKAFPDVPSYVEDYKKEFYSCHKVGAVHVYKLKSDSYKNKLESVRDILEAAHSAALGGPRTNLTGAATASSGFSLTQEATSDSMDVFAPAPVMEASTTNNTQRFDQVTGNTGTDTLYAPEPVRVGVSSPEAINSYAENRYVIGTQGTGNDQTRQPTSLFSVTQDGKTNYQPFATTSQSENSMGNMITQSQSTNQINGGTATTYDGVVEGQRRVQTWLPAQQPGISGFNQAFPEATDVTVSRLQGVQNGGTIEQYSYLNAQGERQYAMGLGGIPDADGKVEGTQGLFVPMERIAGTENSIGVTAAGRETAQTYVQSLTSEDQRTSAQSVFNEAASRTVLNSDVSEGPVGMGYFSTIMDNQDPAGRPETPISQAIEQTALERQPVSVGSLNPVTDDNGKPVFSASRTIESRNVDTGGGGTMDQLDVRSNANLDPTQAQTLTEEAQRRHTLLLEEQVEQARNTYATNRQIYGNPNDANARAALEQSREAAKAAELQQYQYQMRNRPDFLQGEVERYNRSIPNARDDRERQALIAMRDRHQAALSYAQNYRKNPQRLDLNVNSDGTLAGYTFGAGQTTTPAIQASVLADYNRQLESIRSVYGDDPQRLEQRMGQLNEQFRSQGLTLGNGLSSEFED